MDWVFVQYVCLGLKYKRNIKYKRLKVWDLKTSPQVQAKREYSSDLRVVLLPNSKKDIFLRKCKSFLQMFLCSGKEY